MAYPFVDKKILVIKTHCITGSCIGSSSRGNDAVCFNKHFELAWAVMPQTEC